MIDNSEKYILNIGNLPEEKTKQNLQWEFLPFGEIKSTEILYVQTTNKPKGYGFIEFEKYEDLKNIKDIYKRKISNTNKEEINNNKEKIRKLGN